MIAYLCATNILIKISKEQSTLFEKRQDSIKYILFSQKINKLGDGMDVDNKSIRYHFFVLCSNMS